MSDKLCGLNMQDVAIEIIGRFIWLTGNTKPHKEQLKYMTFRYPSKKKFWYKVPSDYKKRSQKEYSMNKIRGKYGSQKVKQ